MKTTSLLGAVVLSAFLLVASKSTHAQTLASMNVAFTPSNTSQCVVFNTGYMPNLQFGFESDDTSYPQGGYCTVAVTLNNTMPSSSYAVSCTVESGVVQGYLYGPEISAVTKSTTGFNLSVHFYVNNTAAYNPGNLGPGAVSLGSNNYVYASAGPGYGGAPYSTSDLGTLYADCIAVSQ